MLEKFEEVLRLQSEHSSVNTPAMSRRGELIRNLIPAEMRQWSAVQSQAVLPFRGRLNVQGRDGTGLKTFVPWVRIHSPELSPSAQSGWYVVYLFRQDGQGVSLGISHGSTRFDGGDFKPRSRAEADTLMSWARGLLSIDAISRGFVIGVDLGSSEKLSRAYERTTAFSKFYSVTALPGEEELLRDAERAVSILGQLYRAIELGRAPEADPPEVAEAIAAVDQIARSSSRSSSRGQGFGLTADERRIVEGHAMSLAQGWLLNQGFDDIRDVHATDSCDFMARRHGVEHFIEVKGTTAGFGKVLMTANEVQLHRAKHPNNLLIVVHDIDLLEMRTGACGGIVTVMDSWVVDDSDLTPLSFSVRLPA